MRAIKHVSMTTAMLVVFFGFAGCGGGDRKSPQLEEAAEPTLTLIPTRTFRFNWADTTGATLYRLLENPDGLSGFTQVGDDVLQGTEFVDHVVPLHMRTNARYILQSCNDRGCVDSDVLSISGSLQDSIGYIKASNPDQSDGFARVSLSGDGNTIAIGAWQEDSSSNGVNGDQSDNSAWAAGAVYVFVRNGRKWQQQAYIKASNTDAQVDRLHVLAFGGAVSLSGDGNTLAVSATSESSNADGINGDQFDITARGSGAVYVFVRIGDEWSQQAYIKASNSDEGDNFGDSISLSLDGNVLAVGAGGEASAANGINGDQNDNSVPRSGAAYIFERNGSNWTQQAYIKASNTDEIDLFGAKVSLSNDGATLAVSAVSEDSSATGIDGDSSDNGAPGSGAAYVFVRNDDGWSQQAYIKASNSDTDDIFGSAIRLSGDATTLAVGAESEGSGSTGINGEQNDNSALWSGAVYVFRQRDGIWSQEAYLKASNTESRDAFGGSVALSDDGNHLAVGAIGEQSITTGINGFQSDNSADNSGAVYFFSRRDGNWMQDAFIKAGNTDALDRFGGSLSLGGGGRILAVGADGEDSSAAGVNGQQGDNSLNNSGAVYLY